MPLLIVETALLLSSVAIVPENESFPLKQSGDFILCLFSLLTYKVPLLSLQKKKKKSFAYL